ncbi:MAG: phosphatase PAP2 family protein [Bacteroidales bacterium]|nr:phosphatase PAP2 family protein [Bacteroidales bacterium]
MKRFFTFVCAAMLVATLSINDNAFAQQRGRRAAKTAAPSIQTPIVPEGGFLAPEDVPDGYIFLPAPPQPGTALYFNDYCYHCWGKGQRADKARADQASADYFAFTFITNANVFKDIFGLEISEEGTPDIYALLKGVEKNAKQASRVAKNAYKRVRPYDQFKEPSLIEERGEEDDLRGSYSYPSGHSNRNWIVAQLLIEINPDVANEIMLRARTFAENRLVCGHHYKSDIDAGMMLAMSVVSTLHGNDAFQAQMARAKAEFQRLTAAK